MRGRRRARRKVATVARGTAPAARAGWIAAIRRGAGAKAAVTAALERDAEIATSARLTIVVAVAKLIAGAPVRAAETGVARHAGVAAVGGRAALSRIAGPSGDTVTLICDRADVT